MSYSYQTKSKAAPRKEWDEFLLEVRKRLGCDSKTIPSQYRVERRYLAHSMKMLIHCDWEPPKTGEFDLGYVEIHEEGLVSYEYEDWAKGIEGRPLRETFVSLNQPECLDRVHAFLDDSFRLGEGLLNIEREKHRQEREEAERKRLAEAERKRIIAEAEAERKRLAEVDRKKKLEARRAAAKESRRRSREATRARLEQERTERQKRLDAENARWERQRAENAARAAEEERVRLAARAERDRKEDEARKVRQRLVDLKKLRDEQTRAEEAARRAAWAEVGVILPEKCELSEPVPERWKPHPVDWVSAGTGVGWLLYWLLF